MDISYLNIVYFVLFISWIIRLWLISLILFFFTYLHSFSWSSVLEKLSFHIPSSIEMTCQLFKMHREVVFTHLDMVNGMICLTDPGPFTKHYAGSVKQILPFTCVQIYLQPPLSYNNHLIVRGITFSSNSNYQGTLKNHVLLSGRY